LYEKRKNEEKGHREGRTLYYAYHMIWVRFSELSTGWARRDESRGRMEAILLVVVENIDNY